MCDRCNMVLKGRKFKCWFQILTVIFVVEKQVQNKMLKIRVKVQVIRNQGNMSTGSELFALLGSGFAQILGQIIFKRVKALRNTNTGEGRIQGEMTPEMTCGFLIQLVFCKKKLCGLLVLKQSKRRVYPLLKKILDPPLQQSHLHTSKLSPPRFRSYLTA